MRVLFTIICIFMVADCAYAQILMSRPYILVIDTSDNTKWKLKKGKYVSITTADGKITEGKLTAFNHSEMTISNDTNIAYGAITSLTFKPKSKVKRVLKFLYYGWFCAGFISIVAEPADGFGPDSYLAFAPLIVAFGEAGGGILQMLSPMRTFKTRDGWSFEAHFERKSIIESPLRTYPY